MKFYQLPNNNLFTHRLLFFSREATSETYGPRVFFLIYLLCDLFYLCFLFRSIKPKIQKYFAPLYFICDLLFQSITTFSRPRTVSGAVPQKGLPTPLTRRVARCCYSCAGAVYVVLLGSPTGSITLVSYLREIPTARCATSSLPLWGNTDVASSDIKRQVIKELQKTKTSRSYL